MEEINYTYALLWYAGWPLAIYISYKFVLRNIARLETKLENKDKR